MSNPAPTLNQINAFNATQGTTIDFNIIGGTEVIRSNKIYIYDLSDNSLICTHLYVSTESIHELPPNTSSSIVYASGKSSADFTNNTQYYAQIQTFTDVGGTQGGSGLSIAKLFWCLPTPTLTLSTIPTTISTTSYNVSATYTPNTSGGATNEIQEFQFNLYSAIGALLQTSGVVLYGEGVDLSYNFSGLEVDSTYYVTLDVTTTQGMNVSAQSNTFTVSIDTPTMGSASVVNNGCDGYISVTSNLSSEYEHEESAEAGEIMSFTTDSVNDITELDVDFSPIQDGTPWMSAQDTTPYMFRPVPTQTEDFGHESDCIVGGTVGWNQLIKNGNFADSSAWLPYNDTNLSISISGGECIATILSVKNNNYANCIKQQILKIAGHKYLTWFDIYVGKQSRVTTGYMHNGTTEVVQTGWNRVGSVQQAEATGTAYVYLGVSNASDYGYAVNDTYKMKNVNIIDLTAYFGSATIADYVYTLEQGTAGAGVAWLRANAPQLFEYHAYDAGSLVSVSGLMSHDMVGFNQWDEEWESGYIRPSTGEAIADVSKIRMKNYMPVLPNTTYYKKTPVGFWCVYFDADKNYIGYGDSGANTTFTTPQNCYFIRSGFESSYGTIYHNDICINLSDASLNGTYKPYTKHSYPLDSTLTLRGMMHITQSGIPYFDGDTYFSNGLVIRKYGIVDLGSLNWDINEAWGYYAPIPSDCKDGVYHEYPNIITKQYPTGIASSYPSAGEITIYGGFFRVGDLTYPDATAFKNAMSGVYLVYEKSTPTTETADSFTNPQEVDPSGTEEYVGSPIPVGHETTYQRICPISGWDSVDVDVVGKNLYDNSLYYVGYDSKLWQNGFNSVNIIQSNNGFKTTISNSYGFGAYLGYLSAGVTYTISFSQTGIAVGQTFSIRKTTTNQLSKTSGLSATRLDSKAIATGANYLTFTTDEDCHYWLGVYDASAGSAHEQALTDVQLELGNQATSYQPYQGTTYTSTFPKYKQQVTQDKTPYVTKDIGDTYADTLTENLVGGTIAWNQLVRPNKPTFTYNGVTITNNGDGTFTFSGTANATGSDAICYTILFQQSHKYILLCKGASNDLRFYDGYGADGYDIGNGKIVYWNRASANGYVYFNVTSGITYNVKVTPMLIDLTQMFGTTIADYIYSLEQATEGAGVAWFKQLFPNDYYEYNSGALISVNASAHVIKDADGNVLHTYPLDSDLVLRGIPKLDANNKLYYDGDVYEPNGSVTRKYGIVDLGSLTYNNANNNLFYCSDAIPNFKTVANWRVVANMACARYTVTYGDDTAAGTDKTISAYGVQPRVFIKDTAYNDSTSLKTSLSGVYLVYELATPTTEQADPFEENQTIVSNGIEEYTVTEQGDVEMPVGHDSTYYATEVYGGTIDMAKGVLTITHKVVDLGNLNYTKEITNWYTFFTQTIKNDVLFDANRATIMLTTYNGISQASTTSSGDNYAWVNPQGIVCIKDTSQASLTAAQFKERVDGLMLVYELATPIEISLTPQQMQTLSGQNNIWSNTNGGMYLVYQLPITSLLVKRRDVADVSGKWLTLYSTPITQASDMDFTFIDFLNQYGKTYQYALVPVLAQDQSGVVVQIEGGYTVSDNVDSIFDGVYIADQTNVERVKAGVGYGNIDMNQGVGSITPIGSKYPIVITNSQNQYHNGSVRGTIVPNDFYSNGNLSRIDMVNKRDELEQFLTNKRAKIIKDWNGKMWLVMIMSNVACSFDDNYGMGMVSFSADWLEVGNPTNQQDLYNAGLINVGGV